MWVDPDRSTLALLFGILALGGCQGPDAQLLSSGIDVDASSVFRISEFALPDHAALDDYADGGPRPLGALMASNGVKEEFVVNEVILRPTDQSDLDDFLVRYNGVVLRDGALEPPPGVTPISSYESSGYYLIRVDPAMSTMTDLAQNLVLAGAGGGIEISSPDAARLTALLLRERGVRRVSPNLVIPETATQEHPEAGGGFIDASQWDWMSDTSDGYSVGVVQAWEYLKYWNVPPMPEDFETAVWIPTRVAIIDRGFALNESTGVPLGGNLDYRYFGASGPIQYDFVDNDDRAGGFSSNGGDWHGTKVFGACCALPDNRYGGAGTGGPVTVPVLLKVSDSFTIAQAIRYSVVWYGADVVNISLGAECGILCELSDIEDMWQNAVYTAIAFNAVVIAAAGNEGNDISNTDFLPCKLDKVICVGSVNLTDAGQIKNVYNYGDGVDIWAPTFIKSTVTPTSAAQDGNDTGLNEIADFGGTSASAPFVAGIAALMKALDPSLRWDDVQRILQETANSADDTKVALGYVNAYSAVREVMPNQPPVVELLSPLDGSSISYGNLRFRANVFDPEPNAKVEDLTVIFTSDRNAFPPCYGNLLYRNGETIFECQTQLDAGSAGNHDVRVSVYDPHFGTGIDRATINVVNTPPFVRIGEPLDGETFFSHQPVTLAAYIGDPEEKPFPQDQVIWLSDLDGELGQGWSVTRTLTEGVHLITATATDEAGATATDSITVDIRSGLGVPTATITAPANGELVSPGDGIILMADGSDPEDGVLPDSAFEWYSDFDGYLGAGRALSAILSGPSKPCNPEWRVHSITLEVTDSDGRKIVLRLRISVGRVC